jgi:GNAT superfamily N-acetyltransferase
VASVTSDRPRDETLEVRRAEDHEARACRLLLPEVFGASAAPDLWVAIDRETALLVGAAAIGWQPNFDPPGCLLHVHVPTPLRRRGIGRALVEAVAEACAGSTPCLHSWVSLPEDGEGAAFLRRLGFAPSRRMLEFAADADGYTKVKAACDRLGAAKQIPASFRVVSLREAPAEEVAALVAEHFRDAPLASFSGLARGVSGHDRERSVVLLEGDAVRGALIYRWSNGEPRVDVWVVAPEVRGSIASLVLLEAAMRNALNGGARRFHFVCTDDNTNTIGLARRGGANLIATLTNFMRRLPA